MTRPRAEERALLAGHLPAADEDELLDEVRLKYPAWKISRDEAGRFTATHRTEEPNPRLERAGWRTTLTTSHLEELEQRLFVQRALRGDGHLADGGE